MSASIALPSGIFARGIFARQTPRSRVAAIMAIDDATLLPLSGECFALDTDDASVRRLSLVVAVTAVALAAAGFALAASVG